MKSRGITLLALRAYLDGDLENLHVAMTPGGIEQQEAIGQQKFVGSETLPRQCGYDTSREQLEAMGIVFGDPVDDLFVCAQLPDGWEKVPEQHSMWSRLVDDKGRKRALIFYKAAFYDRKAHIEIVRRFSYHVQPVGGWDIPRSEYKEWHCVVLDSDEIVWESEECLGEEPEWHMSSEESRLRFLAWSSERDALKLQGKAWLDEHYPDWENPLAYWDEEES